MSEKEVRETLKVLYEEFYVKEVGFDDHTAEAVYGALDKDPDLVWLLRWAYEELEHAGGGGEEAVLMALRDKLEEQVELTPDGWEYTDEANPD